jgi:hypothetical protein
MHPSRAVVVVAILIAPPLLLSRSTAQTPGPIPVSTAPVSVSTTPVALDVRPILHDVTPIAHSVTPFVHDVRPFDTWSPTAAPKSSATPLPAHPIQVDEPTLATTPSGETLLFGSSGPVVVRRVSRPSATRVVLHLEPAALRDKRVVTVTKFPKGVFVRAATAQLAGKGVEIVIDVRDRAVVTPTSGTKSLRVDVALPQESPEPAASNKKP